MRAASTPEPLPTDRGVHLREIDLRHEHGYDVPTAAWATRRVPCSACGLSKRHLFDAAARDGRYDAVATGHNLDDEAAVLLGSTLRWNVAALSRQLPVLPEGRGFPRKIKPLVRLTERETAAWCIVRGIDYQVEECPMAAGNRHLDYKATLNDLEAAITGGQGLLLSELPRPHGATAGRHTGDCREVAGPVQPLRIADNWRRVRVLSLGRGGRRP